MMTDIDKRFQCVLIVVIISPSCVINGVQVTFSTNDKSRAILMLCWISNYCTYLNTRPTIIMIMREMTTIKVSLYIK